MKERERERQRERLEHPKNIFEVDVHTYPAVRINKGDTIDNK